MLVACGAGLGVALTRAERYGSNAAAPTSSAAKITGFANRLFITHPRRQARYKTQYTQLTDSLAPSQRHGESAYSVSYVSLGILAWLAWLTAVLLVSNRIHVPSF